MPRNSSGIYSVPAGTAAVTNTDISSTAYNAFLTDISSAMTNSVNVQGTAPMLAAFNGGGFAIQNIANGVNPTDAATLLQAQSAIPPGMIMPYAVNPATPPAGFLICNGASTSTVTFAQLFAAIGYAYGGSGASFLLPDLRGCFVRGFDNGRAIDHSGTRAVNAFQASSIINHFHTFSDPGHTHGVNDPTHAHGAVTGAHSHTVSDPGHAHTLTGAVINGTGPLGSGIFGATNTTIATTAVATGISINAVGNIGVTVSNAATGISIAAAGTGAAVSSVSTGSSNTTETNPSNYPVLWLIKT